MNVKIYVKTFLENSFLATKINIFEYVDTVFVKYLTHPEGLYYFNFVEI